jgi:HEAT repeat-containing protein 5
VSLCVKSLDNADQVTRHSLAQLVGHILASTQVPRTVPIPESSQKKQPKDQGADDDGLSPGAAQAGEITKPLLTPAEMLAYLSNQFKKPNISRKTRVGIFDFYITLFTKLGASFVENNYSLVIGHFVNEIIGNKPLTSRYDVLLLRTLIGIVLRDLIGVRMLSEQGQIGAIQELAMSYLKRWPAMMPGQSAPSSAVLTIALREVAGLLQQLGNAPPPVQDALSDPLVTLLAHPSHTVRVTAAWTLRCFCYSTPLRLPKTIISVMEMLQRDLSSILNPAAPSDINSRTLGHAYGLAALVCVIPERPLYVSYDVSAKVLDMAIQVLKRAGEHDVKIADVEVEIAWTLIASLMSLGPNFVRPHLQQLLVLWRNALPKPTTKDSTTARPVAEWMFLLHVRESALGSILCFLQHNATALVNLDVGRRIATVLSNALIFANNFISLNVQEDPQDAPGSNTVSMKGLNLRAREALLRRRVYQCFTILGFSSIAESTQATLLQSVVSLFASPDGYLGSSVQAAIASSSGAFTSVWQSTDGYAYGVTFKDHANAGQEGAAKDPLNRDTVEVSVDSLVRAHIKLRIPTEMYDICSAPKTRSRCM